MAKEHLGPNDGGREHGVRAFDDAAADHGLRVRLREASVTGDQDELVRLRHDLLSTRQALDATRTERDHSFTLMRDVNERLVMASVRADELAERADAGRQRAEALAAQLAASEAAARLSEEQFRTIANTVPMLAWSATPDGDIAWFNDRWYEYTGTKLEDQAGRKWESVHDPEDLARVVARWRVALANGEPWEDTFRLRRHDGEFRWFLSRALPLRDVGLSVVRWFGTSVDIDAQKRAEDQARAASRAKDEFLAMLGHELRNPLAPILTALNLMRIRGAAAFAPELTIIERQVRHMVRLVDDLLDVSRIAGGKVELAFEPVDMAAVVTRAIEMASPLIEAKAHHLSVSLAAHGLLVKGDADRLSQVVTNLLTNAAKYTPDHGSIHVAAEREGATVTLRIRDNGIGITPEMLPRVFDLFAQELQAIDRSRGGLGLGLAIVRSLVAMHGGAVIARSDGLGKGSEFVLELPAHDPEETIDPAPAARGQAVAAETVEVSPNVLVVDDNGDAADLVAQVLRAHGYEVRLALDGPTALAIVDGFVPDVALLDIGLPGMDGYELAQRLRERLAPRRISLIAITGYGRDDDRRRTSEAGFDLHLVKPVDFSRIQEAIRQVTQTSVAPVQ
jgi:PAS domain S-box-containing protein